MTPIAYVSSVDDSGNGVQCTNVLTTEVVRGIRWGIKTVQLLEELTAAL